jgi:HemY protein
MRRLLIYTLLALLVAIALVALIEKDPGYVLLSYGYTTVETSLWVALFLTMVVFLSLYLLLRLYSRVTSPQGAVGRWFRQRGLNRSQRLTSAGLINFIEGNWSRARRMHLRAAKSSNAPLVNFLIAARASNELGDASATQAYLREAENSEAAAGIAVDLTQAELQLGNGQLEDALATLMRARKNASKHPYVLRLLIQAYKGLGDWHSLAALMPALKKHKVVQGEQWCQLQSEINGNILQDVANSAEDLDALKATWKQFPDSVKQDSDMVDRYVRQLHRWGSDSEAERVLFRQLKKHWHDGLVQLYGLVAGEDVQKQLLIAEAWLKDRPNNPVLLLCLGRLSLRNQLWGKAREYFEASFKLEQRPETCAELGRLLASLKEIELSNQYFQKGLMLSERGLPTLPQPEQHTLAGVQNKVS